MICHIRVSLGFILVDLGTDTAATGRGVHPAGAHMYHQAASRTVISGFGLGLWPRPKALETRFCPLKMVILEVK